MGSNAFLCKVEYYLPQVTWNDQNSLGRVVGEFATRSPKKPDELLRILMHNKDLLHIYNSNNDNVLWMRFTLEFMQRMKNECLVQPSGEWMLFSNFEGREYILCDYRRIPVLDEK